MSFLRTLIGFGKRSKKPQFGAIPRYPPFFKGIPVVSIDEMMSTQEKLLDKIYQVTSLPKDSYARLVIPVIRNYAAYVHLLPASEAHHHRGAGGLLRHGLEVALFAARNLDAKYPIDPSEYPHQKKRLKERWPIAAIVAGLGHDIGKPLSDFEVTNEEGNHVWDPYIENIDQWSKRTKVDRYFIRWRKNRYGQHENYAALVISRLMTPELNSWFSEAGPNIQMSMMQSITLGEMAPARNPLREAVHAADRESVSNDLKTWRAEIGGMGVGIPAERYLLDTMKELVHTGEWKVNKVGSPLWSIDGDLYIDWEQAVPVIINALDKLELPGITRNPVEMASILVERNIAVSRSENGEESILWSVSVDVEGRSIEIKALKLSNQEYLLPFEVPSLKRPLPINKAIMTDVAQPSVTEVVETKSEQTPAAETKQTNNDNNQVRKEIDGNIAIEPGMSEPAINLEKEISQKEPVVNSEMLEVVNPPPIFNTAPDVKNNKPSTDHKFEPQSNNQARQINDDRPKKTKSKMKKKTPSRAVRLKTAATSRTVIPKLDELVGSSLKYLTSVRTIDQFIKRYNGYILLRYPEAFGPDSPPSAALLFDMNFSQLVGNEQEYQSNTISIDNVTWVTVHKKLDILYEDLLMHQADKDQRETVNA